MSIINEGCLDSTSYNFIYQDESCHVFPNPIEDEVQIVAPLDEHIMRIEIVHISGQSVRDFLIPMESDSKSEIINMRDVTPGVYLVRIFMTSSQYQTKILKK